eukprot:scaffold1837_cov391-Prasinococcus_capsulatus_cf.AAC.4
MRKQIAHMIKHGYLPFNRGKQVRRPRSCKRASSRGGEPLLGACQEVRQAQQRQVVARTEALPPCGKLPAAASSTTCNGPWHLLARRVATAKAANGAANRLAPPPSDSTKFARGLL